MHDVADAQPASQGAQKSLPAQHILDTTAHTPQIRAGGHVFTSADDPLGWLSKQPRRDRYGYAIEMRDSIDLGADALDTTLAALYSYVKSERLYEGTYHYHTFLREWRSTQRRVERSLSRKKLTIKNIRRLWGATNVVLFLGDMPEHHSKYILERISAYASSLPEFERGLCIVLGIAIGRLDKGGRGQSNKQQLQPSDFDEAKRMSTLAASSIIGSPQFRQRLVDIWPSFISEILFNHLATWLKDNIPIVNISQIGASIASGATTILSPGQGVASAKAMPDGQQSVRSDAQQDMQPNMQRRSIRLAAGRLPTPITDQDEDVDSDINEESMDSSSTISDLSDSDFAKSKATAASSQTSATYACQCRGISKLLKNRIEEDSRDSKHHMGTLHLIKATIKHSTASQPPLCWQHVQKLASALGLKTKIQGGRLALYKILDKIYEAHSLDQFKKTHPTLFRRNERPAIPSDALGNYKFTPKLPPKLAWEQLDHTYIHGWLQSLHSTYDADWATDGSLTISNLFSWLFDDTALMKKVMLEFDCYRYHIRERNDLPNRGWNYIMHHSYIQQAIRQYPLYWLLYVALRPDHAPELVSMAYYTKHTVPGDPTKFRHVDLNIPNLLENGIGENLIQGTISFDDETPTDCTEILLGMHRHLHSWWDDVVQEHARRGLHLPDGLIQSITSEHWTEAMAIKYKAEGIAWTPVPCRRGDVRVSLPHLPHGALGPAQSVRRTILPWYIKVADDGENLEMPEAGTVAMVAASHQELLPGKKTPSGLSTLRVKIPYKFPASGHLAGLGPLSDAIMARISWRDPVVIDEVLRIFGKDANASERASYLRHWHKEARRLLYEAYTRFERVERLAYGEQSYFYRREKDLLNAALPLD